KSEQDTYPHPHTQLFHSNAAATSRLSANSELTPISPFNLLKPWPSMRTYLRSGRWRRARLKLARPLFSFRDLRRRQFLLQCVDEGFGFLMALLRGQQRPFIRFGWFLRYALSPIEAEH